MEPKIPVPKSILSTLNQLYEMEQKLRKNGDSSNIRHNLKKIKDAFEHYDHALGLVYVDPLDQPFSETRTDMEATISGHSEDDLVVVEVIKPIIHARLQDGSKKVIQKGIVIVKSRKEKQEL
ncbi:hypothetical protein B188_01310 [Candidatus Brocadiaceae bacterium B188]|nr:hypothetical protein [Candidatus Brocadia sapporoensis]QQR67387.1 MAG: hypothetical protein IPI25_03970 [Candidatus Brocadia sp.]RZV57173.1 MAG: hypothetical protein EX330_10890 [Candidatus Brocadia sp. BROELEC01]TWU52184.1 hypothetical protein B188_01310 [Candidatus Brocadiaceae bacterium B188]